MKITRLEGEKFLRTYYKIKDKSFNIQSQYKVLKLKKIIGEEVEMARQMLQPLIEEFCLKDDEGRVLTDDSGNYKIDPSKQKELEVKLNEYDNIEIQLPDIYFSEDELANLGLTLEELEVFMVFIK